MSDPHYDPIREQHTIMVPAPRNDIFTIIRDNAVAFVFLGSVFAGFAGLVIAWERKANKTEVQVLQKRVLKAEKEIVILKTTLKHIKERGKR